MIQVTVKKCDSDKLYQNAFNQISNMTTNKNIQTRSKSELMIKTNRGALFQRQGNRHKEKR